MSTNYLQYVENALVMLEEKIMRLGTGYTHTWLVFLSSPLQILTSHQVYLCSIWIGSIKNLTGKCCSSEATSYRQSRETILQSISFARRHVKCKRKNASYSSDEGTRKDQQKDFQVVGTVNTLQSNAEESHLSSFDPVANPADIPFLPANIVSTQRNLCQQ